MGSNSLKNCSAHTFRVFSTPNTGVVGVEGVVLDGVLAEIRGWVEGRESMLVGVLRFFVYLSYIFFAREIFIGSISFTA